MGEKPQSQVCAVVEAGLVLELPRSRPSLPSLSLLPFSQGYGISKTLTNMGSRKEVVRVTSEFRILPLCPQFLYPTLCPKLGALIPSHDFSSILLPASLR